MFTFSCTYAQIKPLAKIWLFYASSGGCLSYVHEIDSNFLFASCISDTYTSSTIFYVIYLKVHTLTLKSVRSLHDMDTTIYLNETLSAFYCRPRYTYMYLR